MPVNPKTFFEELSSKGISFFTGVPDSLLKQLCLCIDDNVAKERHVITANEGNAIALAAGYHLASGKLPLVYMQNSGIGNAINPLLSLCDPDVYSIPILLLIGWRGEPGVKDEPQHIKQGKVQLDLLRALDIPYKIISKDDCEVEKKISKSIKIAIKENRPVAILVKKRTFDTYKPSTQIINTKLMTRENSLEIIVNNLPENSIVVSTTGYTSREIFEIRKREGQSHNQDFLTVGSMGHCLSIAIGIAIVKPERKIICIDGDGALIMHMGSLSAVGKLKLNNLNHILINNQVHESVGGQATSAENIDFSTLVKSQGYKNAYFADNNEKLILNIGEFFHRAGPSFLEILVKPGYRFNLGRPTIKPIDNKKSFMTFVQGN
jgi:phosphonopyruvate decarboxylase